MIRLSKLACVGLIVASLASAAEPPLDPEQPYTAARSAPVSYDIDFRVILTAPQGTKQLRVWVPVPPSDRGQEVKPGAFTTFPAEVTPGLHTEPVFGNTFAYFEFDRPQGAQIISYTFRASVWELKWDVDPAKVVRVEKWPAAFDSYRRAERFVLIDDRVKTLAGQLASGQPNPAAELDAVMGWAQQNLTYDHTDTSLVASTDHAL
ncbi:MAG TPA: hypothetical protein VKE74_06915, partial [Gemmataceae bacterium]|nr:hypothetical protein [Gemmataceae bacterium]